MQHLYQDATGVTHACEGNEVHPGIYLVWTKCERDVPANKSFKADEAVTCEKCLGRAPSPSLGEPETLEHVHITDKHAVVTGDPADLPDSVADDDARRHNCDQMGCPSLDHVLYRLPFTDHRNPIDVKVLARQLAESIDFTAGPVQAREAFEKRLDVLVTPASPTAAQGQKAVAWRAWFKPVAGKDRREYWVYWDEEPTTIQDDIELSQLQALFASPVPVSGWVMVPREPTKEMLEAAQSCRLYTEEDGSDWRNSDATWRAMLAAAAVGETK